MLSSLVWLAARPRRTISKRNVLTRTHLALVPHDLWIFDKYCRALDEMLRAWPELEEVTINLGAVNALDDAAMTSLRWAITVATTAGVDLRLEGYNSATAHYLRAQ
jgi:hypothetical protein